MELRKQGFEIPVGKRSQELATAALRGWFPVDEQHLFDFQLKLASGGFEGREDKFFQNLRCDLGLYGALFFSVIKDPKVRLAQSASETPLGALQDVGLEVLSSMLNVSARDVSKHSLEQMNAHQARMLKFSVLSCSATVLMSERAGINPDLGFSLALLRNLNLILLSWNFPSAFSRCADAHYQGLGNLSANIEDLLKFSLVEFTFSTIRRLWLGDRVNALILNPGSRTTDSAIDENTLASYGELEQAIRFCEIGEVLARLGDPENYPGVAAEWESVKKEVRYFLGQHGIALLNQRFASGCSLYSRYSPEIFKRDLDPERDCQVAVRQFNMHRFNRAVHGLELSDEERDRFLDVYSLMNYGSLSKDALGLLFKELLPDLGFEWSCFYVLDAESEVLLPRMSHGEDIWGFKQSIAISTGGEVPRLIFEALTSKTIQRLDRVYTDEITRSHLAWHLGNSAVRGVLYLGSGKALLNVGPKKILSYFLATRQAVCDIVGIENAS